jgi:hypothetical protein
LPPLVFYDLTVFHFVAKSIWGPWVQSTSLYVLRLYGRKDDGTIKSRPFADRPPVDLERWENGKRVWVNPNYAAIMREQQEYLEKVRVFWNQSPVSIDPDDKLPKP